jgi:hypothetical protein
MRINRINRRMMKTISPPCLIEQIVDNPDRRLNDAAVQLRFHCNPGKSVRDGGSLF